MLPGLFDLQTMTVIMWIIIMLSIITGLMLIKSLEKATLRVVTTILIGGLIIGCYQYTRILNKCESRGTKCTFFTMEVPQDGGFIN